MRDKNIRQGGEGKETEKEGKQKTGRK